MTETSNAIFVQRAEAEEKVDYLNITTKHDPFKSPRLRYSEVYEISVMIRYKSAVKL
jgi:hypothetical protein